MSDYSDRIPTYIDTETTINNRGEDAIGNSWASPYHPDNEIVYAGWANGDNDVHTRNVTTDRHVEGIAHNAEERVLVGHNITFDLTHLLNHHSSWLELFKGGCAVWDTMLAEYILTGQTSKFASLDDLSKKYGGTVKDSRMKEYWKAGVCTKDIPEDEIIPYLEEDVSNTRIIYKAQLEKAKELGMLPLIESQMEARLATTMMEYNGMEFNQSLALHYADMLCDRADVLQQKCVLRLTEMANAPEEVEINPNSSNVVSAILFGGELKYTKDIPVLDDQGNEVVYKTGKRKGEVKTKKTKLTHMCEGSCHSDKPVGSNGYHPVGNDELKKLNLEIADAILELRGLYKQIKTYFLGYSALVFPDGKIHGTLNHCSTNTGRLSSSNPNLQNISGKGSDYE